MEHVRIRLLGDFEVAVDGSALPGDAWRRRRGADLVKLLALSEGKCLHRERAIEALWPALAPGAGLANLHKAAHLARKAIGDPDAVVLRSGQVMLAPNAEIETDVDRFEDAGDPDLYTGELLPADRYEAWSLEPRERLRARYLDLLREAGRLEQLVREEPADEDAQRSLMAQLARRGDRHAALRQFQRLRDALALVGLRPSPETVALLGRLSSGPAAVAPVQASAPIAGREAELGVAREAVARLAAGRGGALLVTGEAGIGKTRLCEEVLVRASAAGVTTLRGAAREAEAPAPYAPAVEALDRLLMERPDLVGGLTEAARMELARLSIASPRAPAASGEPPDRQRIFSAIAQLLAHAARERGALLLLDDLHAADAATLGLAHYLARVAPFQPLLVVLAARDDAGGAGPLAELRASLLEQRLATRIRLRPLAADAAAAIVRRVAGEARAREAGDAIWELAEGHPFFTEELAAALGPDGGVAIPAHLYEVLHARLARLDPDVRAALATLAVAGERFTADELALLGDLPEETALATLDAALAAALLREDGARYRFRHALVREALVRGLPAHRRAALHRQAADRLAGAPGASAGRIARHLLAGERPTQAVPWLARAAHEAAAVAAYGDALELCETALAHASNGERAGLLALHADLLLATGDPAAAGAYADAVAVAPDGRSVELRAKQARALLVGGDVPSATAVLGGLTARTKPDACRVAIARGLASWFGGDLAAARRETDAARSLAAELGLREETIEATALGAAVAHGGGDFPGRVRRELTATLARPQLAQTVFDALHCTAEYVLAGGQPDASLRESMRDLRAAAERASARRAEAFAATVLGEAQLLAGDLEAAERELHDAFELNQSVDAVCGQALARLRQGEVSIAHGRRGEGVELLEEALSLARWSPLANHLLYLVYEALLRNAADPRAAVALLDQAQASLEQQRICPFCAAGFHAAATVACARASELARARSFLASAERAPMLWGGDGAPSAAAAEARAALAVVDGSADAALDHLREAAERFAAVGRPLDEARVQAELAALS